MSQRRIGEFLIGEGLVSQAALSRALEFQRTSGKTLSLGGIFLNWGLVGEEALLEALAKLHNCPAVSWQSLSDASSEAVHLLSGEQAFRIGAMPYACDKRIVRVAFANPSNLAAVDEVAAITKRRVEPGVTTEVRLLQAHQRFYARPIPVPLWAVVQKLDRKLSKPPAALIPQEPPVPVNAMPIPIPPPAPETSGTPLETILSLGEPGSESLGAEQPAPGPLTETSTETQTVQGRPAEDQPVSDQAVEAPEARRDHLDPYSDQYSLSDFVAEAITAFGGPQEPGQTGQTQPLPAVAAPRANAAPSRALNPEATLPSRRGTLARSSDSRRPL